MRYINLHSVPDTLIQSYLKANPLFAALSNPRRHANDPSFAAIAARLAFSAYGRLVKCFPSRTLLPASADSPQIVVYDLADCTLFVFRGTKTASDVLRDAWATSVKSEALGGCLVHTGAYVHAAECVFMILAELKSCKKPVVLCGHSMGAIVAKLVSKALGLSGFPLQNRVLLFSCPAISSEGTKVAIKGVSYVNENDAILKTSKFVYRSGAAGKVHTSSTDNDAHTSYRVGGIIISNKRLSGLREVQLMEVMNQRINTGAERRAVRYRVSQDIVR